jgi:hypothetical protein
MTKAELLKRLASYPDDSEVMILDGFEGGGFPREINLGPTTRIVGEGDSDETSDCEGIVGKTVVVLGYGNY